MPQTVFGTDEMLRATAPTTGDTFVFEQSARSFHATVRGAGAVAAVIKLQVSNEESATDGFIDLATITLSGTGTASDGFTSTAPWRFVRAQLVSISGTGAVARLTAGV